MSIIRKTARTTAVLFAIASLQTTAFAQDAVNKPDAKAEKAAWQVNCNPTDDPNVLRCQMMQILTLSKTGQRLLTVVIRPQPKHEKKQPAILLSLPHGLYLPNGVKLQIDEGKPLGLAIRTSDKNGVYTATSLNTELVSALKKGNKLKITMTANNAKQLTLGVSLLGFAAAYDKINLMN